MGADTSTQPQGTAQLHVVCDPDGRPAAVLIEVHVTNPFGVDDRTSAEAFLRGLQLGGFSPVDGQAATLQWEPAALAGLGTGSLSVAAAGTTLYAGDADLPAPLVRAALHTGTLAVLVTASPSALEEEEGRVDLGPLAADGRLVGALCSLVLTSKPGRNDRCWCGSGAKWKRCCAGPYTQAVARLAAARDGDHGGDDGR